MRWIFGRFVGGVAPLVMVWHLSSCTGQSEDSYKPHFPRLTTPALERIPELRRSGATKAQWEELLVLPGRRLATARELREYLSGWELASRELDQLEGWHGRAEEVLAYGTDLDGRMILFFDQGGHSIASWASWDP